MRVNRSLPSTERAQRFAVEAIQSGSLHHAGRIVMIIAMLAVAAFVVGQAAALSRAVVHGRVEATYTTPLYGYMKSPTGLARQADAKFGADYMALYFAAGNYRSSGQMYDDRSDPWGRPAMTFPPHLIFIVAHSLQRLEFPTSVLLNAFIQIVVLTAALLGFLRRVQTSVWTCLTVLLLTGLLLFATPVGTTWFERSQTDLYVAAAFIVLLMAIRDDRLAFFALAGALASLKWSSLPFLASSSLTYLCFSPRPWKLKLAAVLLMVSLAVLLALPFGVNSIDYLKSVAAFEINSAPRGISLQFYMPAAAARVAVFVLPAMMIALRPKWRRASWGAKSVMEVVYWGGTCLVAASYGTVAYEYRLVHLLFLVPYLASGRSLLFRAEGQRLTPMSRAVGIAILVFAFRVETFATIDGLLAVGRGVLPLVCSVLVILGISAWSELRPHRSVA